MTTEDIMPGAGQPARTAQQSRHLSLTESMLSWLFRGMPIKHGKHRILDYVAPKVWRKSDKPVTFSFNGRPITVDPNDLVGWHFVMIRSFDPAVVEVLEKACDPHVKEVFWDIGANKGACFCRLGARLPLLQVVAIEPQSRLYANNIMNLESVCPGRYEYVRAGVGEEESELTLVIPNRNLGRASLHIQHVGPDDATEVIKIQTASQIAANSRFGWPTVLKIDVEGHEPQVFASLKPFIEARTCKVIIFENHARDVEAFEKVAAITEPFGYQIYGISKSLWNTALVPTGRQMLGVTDYAVIRPGLFNENQRLARLISRRPPGRSGNRAA